MYRRARLRGAVLLLCAAAGCGDGANGRCSGAVVPSALVDDAALFRVDFYSAIDCAGLATATNPVASLTRTFAAGAPIVVDAPPGRYAVVLSSYSDTSATLPLGTACSDATFAAGARLCLALELSPADLASGEPGDLGPIDLMSVDLAYVAGTVLARDDFHRADQKSWGVASDGQSWGGSAGGSTSFAIAANSGQVTGGGNATYPANLGPPVSDAEALATGTITAAGGHWGAQLRNAGNSTTYSAMLDGTTIAIRRVLAGATSVIAMTDFVAATGTSYSIRFRASGTMLKTRVWPAAGAEPSSWTLTGSDAAPLGPGFGGVRFYVPAGSVAVSSFVLTAL